MSLKILAETGYTLAELASVCRVSEHSAKKYLYGERALSVDARAVFAREHGDKGKRLVGILDRRRAEYEKNYECVPGAHKRMRKRDTPATPTAPKRTRPARDAVNPPDPDWDGEKITITEWIERYGRPGNAGPDINGRYSGYFDTEPCWLGE